MSGTVQQLFPTGNFGSVSAQNAVVTGTVTTAALILPTNGGTATPLTDYEEGSIPNFVWNTANYSPASVTQTLTFVRIGNTVTLHVPPLQVTGTGAAGTMFVSTSALPARLCPVSSNVFAGYCMTTTASGFNGGILVNNSGVAGQLAMGAGSGLTAFANAGATLYGSTRDSYFEWNVLS